MSELKVTKGDWVVDVYSGHGQVDVISECGRKILHCNKRHFGGSLTCEDLANAHLIAAAPEMYALLEDYVQLLEFDGYHVNDIKDLLAKARGGLL